MSEEKKKSKKKASDERAASSNKLLLAGVFLLGIIIGGIGFVIRYTPHITPKENQEPVQEGMIQSLITATEVDPMNALLWVQLGNAYYDTDQVKAAIQAYNKALSINPNMPEVLVDYGTMLRADANLEEALQTYNKALSISKNNPLALYNKGLLLYYDMKNKAEAIETWDILVTQSPHARTPDGRLIRSLLTEMKK